MTDKRDERQQNGLQIDLDQEQALADLDQSVADHDQAVADRDQDELDHDQQVLEDEHPGSWADRSQFHTVLEQQRALDIRQARADARQEQLGGSRAGGSQRQALIDDQQRELDDHATVVGPDVQEFRVDQAARRKAALQRADSARERAREALARAEAAEQRARAIVERDTSSSDAPDTESPGAP